MKSISFLQKAKPLFIVGVKTTMLAGVVLFTLWTLLVAFFLNSIEPYDWPFEDALIVFGSINMVFIVFIVLGLGISSLFAGRKDGIANMLNVLVGFFIVSAGNIFLLFIYYPSEYRNIIMFLKSFFMYRGVFNPYDKGFSDFMEINIPSSILSILLLAFGVWKMNNVDLAQLTFSKNE